MAKNCFKSHFFNLMMLEDKIENLDTLAFASLIGWPIEKVRARFKEIILDEGVYTNPNTGQKILNYKKNRAYPFIEELTIEEVSKLRPILKIFQVFLKRLQV